MQWLPSNQWRSQAWASILATPLLPMQWQQWLPSDAVVAVASFRCSGSSGFLPMQWQQWLPSDAVASFQSVAQSGMGLNPGYATASNAVAAVASFRCSGSSGFLPMQWQQWLPFNAVATVASFQSSDSSGFLPMQWLPSNQWRSQAWASILATPLLPMQWQQWLPSDAVVAVASFRCSGSSGFLPMQWQQWLPSDAVASFQSVAQSGMGLNPGYATASNAVAAVASFQYSGSSGFLPMQWQQWLPFNAVATVASFQCSGSSGFLLMQWQQWLPSNAVAAVASFRCSGSSGSIQWLPSDAVAAVASFQCSGSSEGMDAYIKIWLQFAFPIYIWILVGLLAYASNYSTKIARILGPTNPVAVLSTLFLPSFTTPSYYHYYTFIHNFGLPR